MGKCDFGFSSLVAIATLGFLTLHMICPIALAAQQFRPTSLLPLALRDRLSPLSRRQVAYYGNLMKREGPNAMTDNILYEFCKSARVLCGASTNLPTSEYSFADSSIWHDDLIDRSFFRGWAVKRGRQNPLSSSFSSRTGAEPTGLQQHPTTSIGAYFREKDLVVGAKLVLPPYLYDPNKEGGELSKPSFLPASIALSLPPFDSHHLSDLLQLFHIPSDSHMAQQVKKVLGDCDEVRGLGKNNFMINFCATSFEAMLNFVSSMLSAPNNMIQALTNSKVVGRPGSQVTIVETVQLAAAHDTVDCHDLTFPFKVMGCHRIKDSTAFMVRLASEERLTMDLLVACHKNTTLFNPQHEAFFQLKSSPGHTDVCHWLPNNDNMWIPL